MNEKTKAITRTVGSGALILATVYCYFGLHDLSLTAGGFFALGVLGLLTHSQFSPAFLVGLFFLCLLIPTKALRLAALFCLLAVFALQFRLMLKFKGVVDQIKQNGGDLRSAMWDHDLSVWMWRKVFRKADAA